ncbi:hypothetical protein AYI70_g4203 [Smittium culicis]|uniref:Uncharacterized protein n=1 Tax=Smittium culicis TaxID=133412 RepID=A0A1R1Y023_9FUNG|nr:hypothetical protein AYI70_g4203 [Smittium culicis]
MNTDNQTPQSTETQIDVMIRAINALTAKVDNLTVERATEPTAEEDQHITANVPATDRTHGGRKEGGNLCMPQE